MSYSTPAPSHDNHNMRRTRYASAHASSSAFSASANPNEDWTKVSDLAERRRIQNRIAQRNYRKKLKRRLEDLERRAGSTSPSPEQSHSELAKSSCSPPTSRSQSQLPLPTTPPRRGSQSSSHHSSETPLNLEESLFDRQTPRQLSASPPPPFPCSSFLPEQPDFFWAEPEQMTYGGLLMNYSDNADFQELCYSGLSNLHSSTVSYAPLKEGNPFGHDTFMNPFSMTYASMTGIDNPSSQGYVEFSPLTPPLTDSLSFGDSRESSPTLLPYQSKPFSIAPSPTLSIYGTS